MSEILYYLLFIDRERKKRSFHIHGFPPARQVGSRYGTDERDDCDVRVPLSEQSDRHESKKYDR